jgi:hypothetical protein
MSGIEQMVKPDSERGRYDAVGDEALDAYSGTVSHLRPRAIESIYQGSSPQVHTPAIGLGQEAQMTLNFEQLETKLGLDTLQRVGAWSAIKSALKEPSLFGVDFQPSDFDLTGNRFEGLADVLLTYHDEVSGRDDQSITIPATVRGHIEPNGSVVVDKLEMTLD